MSAIRITTDHVAKTIQFIVANANRNFKEALEAYHNPENQHYRNYATCHAGLQTHSNNACQRLHSLCFLFSDHPQTLEDLKQAKTACLEDQHLFGSLLIAGKHYKDQLLTNTTEAA